MMNHVKKVTVEVIGFCIILLLFITSNTSNSEAEESTIIRIDPPDQVVSPGDTFTVDVYCIPKQAIKAFELKLSFDPLIIQANSVIQGTIFDGYTTFFNAGTIDNTAGTIVNIYDLILGMGSVNDPGTFVSISFTARSDSGVSLLDIYDAGVTNEVGYIPISVTDGYVTISDSNLPPTFSALSPNNESTDVSISTSSVELTIEDTEGDLFNWSIVTNPNIGNNLGIDDTNGSKTCSISGLSYDTTYHWIVSCQDQGSERWTNMSYWFTTEEEPSEDPSSNGGDEGGSGDGPSYVPPENVSTDNEVNVPPETPVKPSGPTSIEMGMDYVYSSSTYDYNGDLIRYRFDWGDGTVSEWSDFVPSNSSISLSHSWNSISFYQIWIIAQDELYTNSSWSVPLEVAVSQIEGDEYYPIAEIYIFSNGSTNLTILFDASGSYDTNGVIVSYQWDFGDGDVGSGINSIHTYEEPGRYDVTLEVTDNDGKTFSKSIQLLINSEVEESKSEENGFLFGFDLVPFCIGIAILLSLLFIFFFRKNIASFIIEFRPIRFSSNTSYNKQDKIELLDKKIEELKRVHRESISTDFLDIGMDDIPDNQTQDNHLRAKDFIDSQFNASFKKQQFSHKSDKDHMRDHIDKYL